MDNLEQITLDDLSKVIGLLNTTHKADRLLAYSKVVDNSVLVSIPQTDLFTEQGRGHFGLQLCFPSVNDKEVLSVRLGIQYKVEQGQNVGMFAHGKWCNLLSAPIPLKDLLNSNFFAGPEKANVLRFVVQNINKPSTLRLVSNSDVVIKLCSKDIPPTSSQLKVKTVQSFTLAIREIECSGCLTAARQLTN